MMTLASLSSSARTGALLSILVAGGCAADAAAPSPTSDLEEAAAASVDIEGPVIPSHFTFSLESGATVEAELVRSWKTAEDDRLLFRSGGREVEMRTSYGQSGDVVIKGQKILQNGRLLAQASFYASGEIVVTNERGDEFRGRGGLDIDQKGTATFDPLAISLLDERTHAGLHQLGLTADIDPVECPICIGIALCCVKITIYGDCDSDGNCGGGGSIGFDCTCL
jgi:hypothetical protein